jgi:hypothetical protein
MRELYERYQNSPKEFPNCWLMIVKQAVNSISINPNLRHVTRNRNFLG